MDPRPDCRNLLILQTTGPLCGSLAADYLVVTQHHAAGYVCTGTLVEDILAMRTKLNGCGCLAALAILLLNALLGGVCTQYVIEFWGTYFRHVAVYAPLWICVVGGLFLGEFTIPAALLTWLLTLAHVL
jgi:hypothetical protein